MNTIRFIGQSAFLFITCAILYGCSKPASYDLILRGGTIYDGSGGQPFTGDVAFQGDTIAALGDIGKANAGTELMSVGWPWRRGLSI